MSGLRIELVGLKEAVAALAVLPDRLSRKHMRIAMSAAGGILKRDAVSRVPHETGLLKKSLSVKVKANKRGEWFAAIGPKRGMKRPVTMGRKGLRAITEKRAANLRSSGTSVSDYRNPSRYAHLVEGGTRRHVITTNKRTLASAAGRAFGRRVTVKASGRFFLRKAVQASGGAAQAKAIQKLREGLAVESRRLKRAG